MDSTPLDEQAVQALYPKIIFELIPDCPAATAAGYTTADRATAQTWYPPIEVGKNIICAAWHGNILDFATNKSTILTSRDKKTGKLNYAKNCDDYKLDISPNYLGGTSTICRAKLYELDGSLYLCDASITNTGPQMYCVDVKTGDLKWAIAYAPPSNYVPPAGQPADYILTKGNYSYLRGKSSAISDLAPIGGYFEDNKGKKHKLIFVGVSSLQNFINSSYNQASNPEFDDLGQCVCIEDLGNTARVYWRTLTCAPRIKVGDVISKSGPDYLDPFRPDQDQVVILSTTTEDNYFIQPYFMIDGISPIKTTPIITNVIIKKDTKISPSLLQPIWTLVPEIFLNDNRSDSYNLAGVISLWKDEQAKMTDGQIIKYLVWSYVPSRTIELAKGKPGNTNISYFKYLNDGEQVKFEVDAMGLNYYGNSTWGAPPTLLADKNLIIFETGQAHQMPQDETLYYSQPSLNFNSIKKPILNMVDMYLNKYNISLGDVKVAKKAFTTNNNIEALNVLPKSRRGRMSYSDGIIALNIVDKGKAKKGGIAFALRTTAWDNYSFLEDLPQGAVYPVAALDADCSSGVHYFVNRKSKDEYLAAATKAGLGVVIDITKLDQSIPFNHLNLTEVGVTVSNTSYLGANAALGGTNYQTAMAGSMVVCTQANTSWFSGSTSTSGEFERTVSNDGKLIPTNDSYISAFDILSGEIKWETPLGARSLGQVVINGNNVFTQDCIGNVYVLDLKTGRIIWKFNGPSIGMNGGIAAPLITTEGIVWINNYYAFGLGGKAGRNGAIFVPDPQLVVKPSKPASLYLKGFTFRSWDSSPKISPNPAIIPVQQYFVVHKWRIDSKGDLVCQMIETVRDENHTYQLVAKSYDYPVLSLSDQSKTIKSCRLRFLNANTYQFDYLSHDGISVTAWLNKPL